VGGARALSFPFLEGGGPAVRRGWGILGGGGPEPGGQGSGPTHDVTGHVWMLGDRRSPERLFVPVWGGA